MMLDVSGLTASYGGTEVLKGIDVRVKAGTVVAVIGANGAGKTTLINTISGVVAPSAGTVRFAGSDVTNLAPHLIARGGLVQVPEGRRVFGPLTVLENLELGRQAIGTRSGTMSDNLSFVFELFPRLRERQRQLAGSLSGGEQQMLAIGRALMARPTMLLLDEPSLGLAPLVTGQLFDTIARLSQLGVTLLLVEQNARRALLASSRAYVLERGKIVREGPSDELANDPAIRAAYLGGETEQKKVQV